MQPRSTPREPVPVLVITGEMRGWLEPCGCAEGMLGGLPRRAALLERLQATGRVPVPLDLGDLIDLPSRQTDLKLEALAASFRLMGVRAVVLGERDLMLGIERLGALAAEAQTTILATNLVRADPAAVGAVREPALPPGFARAVVIDTSAGRVRVEGHVAPTLRAEVEALTAGAWTLAEPAVAVDGGADAGTDAALPTVVLFHGTHQEAEALFGQRPGVALVAAGHAQEMPEPARRLASGALLVAPGDKGKFAAVVALAAAPSAAEGASATGTAPASVAAIVATLDEMAALSDLVPDAHEAHQIYLGYRQRLFEENLVEGFEEQPITGGRFVGAETCGYCHAGPWKVFQTMGHKKAFEVLAPKNATRDPECLACHTTGFGYASGFKGEERTAHLAHVGCESCHGVGSNHVEAPRPGFGRIPNPEALCVTCHDAANSPGFDFPTYWERIRHGRD